MSREDVELIKKYDGEFQENDVLYLNDKFEFEEIVNKHRNEEI